MRQDTKTGIWIGVVMFGLLVAASPINILLF
jgi:hypothetical protein